MLNKHKMGKHFLLDIGEDTFTVTRNDEAIAVEAALDGIYVLRTSLPADTMDPPVVVASYKTLAGVERVFRGCNTDLDIRPIRHRTETRVGAHVPADAVLLPLLASGPATRADAVHRRRQGRRRGRPHQPGRPSPYPAATQHDETPGQPLSRPTTQGELRPRRSGGRPVMRERRIELPDSLEGRRSPRAQGHRSEAGPLAKVLACENLVVNCERKCYNSS